MAGPQSLVDPLTNEPLNLIKPAEMPLSQRNPSALTDCTMQVDVVIDNYIEPHQIPEVDMVDISMHADPEIEQECQHTLSRAQETVSYASELIRSQENLNEYAQQVSPADMSGRDSPYVMNDVLPLDLSQCSETIKSTDLPLDLSLDPELCDEHEPLDLSNDLCLKPAFDNSLNTSTSLKVADTLHST